LAYYQCVGPFHDIPFADEKTIGSSSLPPRWNQQIFDLIESELKECSENMQDAAICEYGRAPLLLPGCFFARLYLNAPIYRPENIIQTDRLIAESNNEGMHWNLNMLSYSTR
jgi:hypothetical protein